MNFAASTKVHKGHDQYVPFDCVAAKIGQELAEKLKGICLQLYNTCYIHAYSKGVIIADAKFEFGLDKSGNLVLADEIFTPDSSRFWRLEDYKTGTSPKSYDKQFLRDWLVSNKINGEMPFNHVPDYVYDRTAQRYEACLEKFIRP